MDPEFELAVVMLGWVVVRNRFGTLIDRTFGPPRHRLDRDFWVMWIGWIVVSLCNRPPNH